MSSNTKLIDENDADLIIGLRDGDVALVYLYLCRRGLGDPDQISRDLYLPRQRLNEALERLEMLGLSTVPAAVTDDVYQKLPSTQDASSEKLLQQEVRPAPSLASASGFKSPSHGSDLPFQADFPQYTAGDIRSRQENDDALSAMISEAQLIVGRALSSPDLVKLLGMYDHLDLPAEVMMELMNFVAEVYRWKYGERRRPSVHAFELEARVWVERNITDLDAAERYIRMVRERRTQEGAIKAAMKIDGRDFTDTERRYVTQWLDWGFNAGTIAVAYDKTVTNTRKFSPAYMNKILMSWNEKGLHTLEEIREKDRKRTASNESPRSSAEVSTLWDTVNSI